MTYHFVFLYTTVAEEQVTRVLLTRNQVVYALVPFALVAGIKSKMTRPFSVFSLRTVRSLSNINFKAKYKD